MRTWPDPLLYWPVILLNHLEAGLITAPGITDRTFMGRMWLYCDNGVK